MKLLVIAHACNAYEGSEGGVGWRTVLTLANRHELCVLTGSRVAEDLRRAKAEGLVPANVEFRPFGRHRPWHSNRLIARLQSWVDYYRWMAQLPAVAGALLKERSFDLVHHVTYTTWRVPNPLVRLPLPFVWGPIGGVASCPPEALPLLSPAARIFERIRNAASGFARFSGTLQACLKHSAVIVAANEETRRFLVGLGAAPGKIEILSPAVFGPEKLSLFGAWAGKERPEGPLRLFAGGNLIGTKGVALALRALAKVKTVDFLYTVAGGGPEEPHLQELAAALGIADRVRFCPGFTGEDYVSELGRTHILLLPSFREIAGITMMEAMLAGCVPVVAKASAQGEIVTPECGIAVPVGPLNQMVEAMAEAIRALAADRERLATLGKAASRRIAEQFSVEHYEETIQRVYEKLR